jgi:hypothetical protein
MRPQRAQRGTRLSTSLALSSQARSAGHCKLPDVGTGQLLPLQGLLSQCSRPYPSTRCHIDTAPHQHGIPLTVALTAAAREAASMRYVAFRSGEVRPDSFIGHALFAGEAMAILDPHIPIIRRVGPQQCQRSRGRVQSTPLFSTESCAVCRVRGSCVHLKDTSALRILGACLCKHEAFCAGWVSFISHAWGALANYTFVSPEGTGCRSIHRADTPAGGRIRAIEELAYRGSFCVRRGSAPPLTFPGHQSPHPIHSEPWCNARSRTTPAGSKRLWPGPATSRACVALVRRSCAHHTTCGCCREFLWNPKLGQIESGVDVAAPMRAFSCSMMERHSSMHCSQINMRLGASTSSPASARLRWQNEQRGLPRVRNLMPASHQQTKLMATTRTPGQIYPDMPRLYRAGGNTGFHGVIFRFWITFCERARVFLQVGSREALLWLHAVCRQSHGAQRRYHLALSSGPGRSQVLSTQCRRARVCNSRGGQCCHRVAAARLRGAGHLAVDRRHEAADAASRAAARFRPPTASQLTCANRPATRPGSLPRAGLVDGKPVPHGRDQIAQELVRLNLSGQRLFRDFSGPLRSAFPLGNPPIPDDGDNERLDGDDITHVLAPACAPIQTHAHREPTPRRPRHDMPVLPQLYRARLSTYCAKPLRPSDDSIFAPVLSGRAICVRQSRQRGSAAIFAASKSALC